MGPVTVCTGVQCPYSGIRNTAFCRGVQHSAPWCRSEKYPPRRATTIPPNLLENRKHRQALGPDWGDATLSTALQLLANLSDADRQELPRTLTLMQPNSSAP